MKKIDLSLYVITDENLTGNKIIYAVEQAILGGASVIQYRAKIKNVKEMYQDAVALKKICSKHNIPFIINDRVDIALAVDADGVHIGQNDMPVEVVRRLLGKEKILGLSTKNLNQVKEANYLPIDYIGFGSIFPTKTKKDTVLSGIEKLKEAVKLSIQPVVAVGGINHSNVKLILETGCKNIAVVSAVFGKEDIFLSTKKLKELLG